MKFSPAQFNSILRHVYTALGTASVMVVAFHFLPQGTVDTITAALHQIGDGAALVISGVSALVPVVSAVYASIAASTTSRTTAVSQEPDVKVVVGPNAPVAIQNLADDKSEALKGVVRQ